MRTSPDVPLKRTNLLVGILARLTGSYRSRVTLYLYLPIALGIMALGGLFGGLGVVLVYLGAKGNNHIKLFGQTIESADAGVVSIFLGAVLVIMIIRKLLSLTVTLAQGEGTSDYVEDAIDEAEREAERANYLELRQQALEERRRDSVAAAVEAGKEAYSREASPSDVEKPAGKEGRAEAN